MTLFVGFAVWGGITLTQETGRVASIWLPNGFVLAFLLFSSRKCWPVYLLMAFAANVIGNIMAGDTVPTAFLLSALNSFEIILAAWPLSKILGVAPDFSQPRAFLKFVVYGMALAPAVSSALASIFMTVFNQTPLLAVFSNWFLADALGMGITTPIVLAILRGDMLPLFSKDNRLPAFLWLVACLITMGSVFYQTRYPFLFFIPPVLLAATVIQGFAAVVLYMPFLTLIALLGTITGHGPFALAVTIPLHEKIVLTQLFIFSNFMMTSFVANNAAERRRIAQKLEEEHGKLIESENQFRLLSDNSADMVFRVRGDGTIEYASPSVLQTMGWKPEEMIGRKAVDFTHPDDVHLRQQFMEQLKKTDDFVADRVRGLRKDGSVIWLERRTRPVIINGTTIFVSNARDITANVEAENLLAQANEKLLHLAKIDGLTGIANRRFFDEVLLKEWRRSEREGRPISLILLDVDHFKKYNDLYGHQQGDACLSSIAEKLKTSVYRPGDLPARYGGEEFAVILSECAELDARKIAENIRSSIEDMRLPHAQNTQAGNVVTASIGVSTLYPKTGDDSVNCERLIKLADDLLYEAKRTGRNKVVSKDTISSDIPNVLKPDEDKRIVRVKEYAQNAWNFSETLNNIAYLAANMIGTPIALVSLVSENNQIFVGRYGLDVSEMARDVSFCAHTLNGTLPMVIPDATKDKRFEHNDLVTGGLGIRFYAGAPLVTSDDQMNLGALCIIDQKPRSELSDEHKKLLGILAALAVKCMEQKNIADRPV